jgi:hypothetical protein
MNIEEIRDYGIAKPAVTEGFPFNDRALAIELREQHPEVTPAWHFNKTTIPF